MDFDTSIRYIKGIGEKRAALFARLNILTAGDLLRHYPRHYEDWSKIVPVHLAPVGEPCCIKATALDEPRAQYIRKGLTLFRFTASDGISLVYITLFNNKFAAAKIKTGTDYLFFGSVTQNGRKIQMTSPLIEPVGTGARIRPLYPQTEGLSSRQIEAAVSRVLTALGDTLNTETLPPEIIRQHQLCSRRFALENIHFPRDDAAISEARRRLVFEELLVLQVGLWQVKRRSRAQTGAVLTRDYTADFLNCLPFTLTGAQSRAMTECLADMTRPFPMSRLVQGDVGSGKTAVAAGVAFSAIRNGFQVALMAPTEILARQHYESFRSLFAHTGITVGLLTGSLSARERRPVLEGLSSGSLSLIIGTHALISAGVSYRRLGLVITDEQHRFGVAQRAALADKGVHPHLLVMSATPIPRTLGLILYGDLDISVLDELPPGRQPIATYAIGTDKRERAYAYVRKFLAEGRQAYVVCPLVEEGDAPEALTAATAYYKELAEGPLSGFGIGLLHGRMKSAEKEQVMADFSANRLSVLVATTVIEVGVDVPNAVLMVVENAERFGLAQLHQLRGRVGRGPFASTCILISDAANPEALQRLKILCRTNDGFRVADEDLKLRGPGDFFGNRQHGLPTLRLADLKTDVALLREAQAAAEALFQADPQLTLPTHQGLSASVCALFSSVGTQGLN